MTPSYEVIGNGPEVVLIPGNFGDRRTWSRVLGRLSARLEAVFDLWTALAESTLPDHAVHLGLVLKAFGRGAFENGTVRAIVREMDRNPIDRATIRRYIECDRRLDLNPVMRNVDAATLVMVASQDALTGLEQARTVSASVPGARLEVIDDADHSPHLETPMAFTRIVTSFLKG